MDFADGKLNIKATIGMPTFSTFAIWFLRAAISFLTSRWSFIFTTMQSNICIWKISQLNLSVCSHVETDVTLHSICAIEIFIQYLSVCRHIKVIFTLHSTTSVIAMMQYNLCIENYKLYWSSVCRHVKTLSSSLHLEVLPYKVQLQLVPRSFWLDPTFLKSSDRNMTPNLELPGHPKERVSSTRQIWLRSSLKYSKLSWSLQCYCIVVLYYAIEILFVLYLCDAGALVGPPWSQRENGFIFTEKQTDGIKLYYEPHCQAKENSFEVDSVDAVITPVTDQIIGGLYPLVSSNVTSHTSILLINQWIKILIIVRQISLVNKIVAKAGCHLSDEKVGTVCMCRQAIAVFLAVC